MAKGSGSNADQLESEMLTRELVWYQLLPIHQREMALFVGNWFVQGPGHIINELAGFVSLFAWPA